MIIAWLEVRDQQDGHVPRCHARQNGLLASRRASQGVIPMSWSSSLLIVASICRSRDRRRQIPIKAIQSSTCCVMRMIFVLRWDSQHASGDSNDRQDVRRAATQSHPFSASQRPPGPDPAMWAESVSRLPSFRSCCRAPKPQCRISFQLVAAYVQTATRCFG